MSKLQIHLRRVNHGWLYRVSIFTIPGHHDLGPEWLGIQDDFGNFVPLQNWPELPDTEEP